MFSIGVGIGIGIEPSCVLRRVFMNGIASLSEFRQHRDDTVEQRLLTRVFLIPFNFLSIPIPIATPTPILLRQQLYSTIRCPKYTGGAGGPGDGAGTGLLNFGPRQWGMSALPVHSA